MTTKAKIEPIEPVDAPAGGYATADEMATVLDELADLSERVGAMERSAATAGAGTDDAARRRAAAERSNDPVFLATTGHGRRPPRQSEGERQDEIQTENARAHLFEPAGDGVVTGPITSGAVGLDHDHGHDRGMDEIDATGPVHDPTGVVTTADEPAREGTP